LLFDIYLKQAEIPELIRARMGDQLTLAWKTPEDLPFPMPIEVKVGDEIVKLPMTDGTGTITVPEGAHVVVDPWARVLKQSDAIDAYQQWIRQQMAKRAAAEKK
jgi:hypothetical protein